MSNDRIALGKKGEETAVKYLKKKRYRIIERNFRCRQGEIDIIALHQRSTVFIEVKTRTDDSFGLPQEAVDYRKQKQIIRCARNYIKYKRLPEEGRFRFDVVGVDVCGKKPVVTLIPDAFQEEGR